MYRVSSNLASIDSQYYMMMRDWKLNQAENKLSSGSRIQSLRDDPLAASHSTRYLSKYVRLEQYQRNINNVDASLSFAEVKVYDALQRVHDIRELALQGANGIYTKEQLAAMGGEVDQYLGELVDLANSRDKTSGNMIFGGFETKQEPFRVLRGRVENGDGNHIVEVQYRGDIGKNVVNVSEESIAQMNIPGNYVFWAENQSIYSSIDARNYQVQQNSTIRIDGVDIELKAGDNVYAIISRINDSPAQIRAHLDPVKDSLVLETTNPHQIWVEEVGGSTVMTDLGIVKAGRGTPPNNYADSANVYGGSVFDSVIALRDSLYAGDAEGINRAIGGLDLSIEAFTSHLAEIGAVSERIQGISKRTDIEKYEVTKNNAKEVNIDLAEAIQEMKMLETAHQAALGTASRILRPTLLDFLR